MNRGSREGVPPTARNRACFNEAPIHESGKFPDVSHRLAQVLRFNEAPIHESGK